MSTNSNEDGGTDLRRGPWTHEEDNLLTQFISSYGEGRWNTLAKLAKLRRTGKSCRLRWLNYLKPDIKRGNLSHHEQLLILELHSKWGNRWSKIAQHLPGRTDNEIKNYWRTRVQKQARQLKVDSNSTKFLEMLRLYWMPRLREKMEQSQNQNQSSYSVSASPFSSTFESSSFSSENLKNGSNLNPPAASPPALYGNNDYSGTDKSAYPLATETKSQFIELANEKGVGEGEGWENLELLETNCGFTGCYVEEIDWMGEELGGSCFWGSDGSVYTHML